MPRAAKPLPPLARTLHAYAIGPRGAILLGTVNPRNQRTVVRFEYGRTRSYGRVAPRYVEEEWFGDEDNEAEELVECLRPRTRYHYRIVATSRGGTAYGEDRTFRTRRSTTPPLHRHCDAVT